MWCDNCSKKFDETGHVCLSNAPSGYKGIVDPILSLIFNEPETYCSFCLKKAKETIGKIRACEDHSDDALGHRDSERDRGE